MHDEPTEADISHERALTSMLLAKSRAMIAKRRRDRSADAIRIQKVKETLRLSEVAMGRIRHEAARSRVGPGVA